MTDLFTQLFSIFAVVLFLYVLKFLFIRMKKKRSSEQFEQIDTLPYEKIESVMTPAEQNYFRQLEQQYGQQCYIFPQVKLDKIISTTDQTNFYRYWNKINKKSIDFVLVDKQTLQTVQLIELNDYTHNGYKRASRDSFLKKVCDKAGVELQFIK